MRWRFFLGALALFVIAIAVNATILFSTLSGSFAEAVAEQYRSIATTLTLAKTNSVFVADDELRDRFLKLAQQRVAYITLSRQRTLALSTSDYASSESVVALTDEQGLVVNSPLTVWQGQYLFPLEVLNSIAQRQEVAGNESGSVTVRQGGYQYIAAPYSGNQSGYAVIRLTEGSVNPSFIKFLHQVEFPFVLIVVLGFVALFLVSYLTRINFDDSVGTRRRFVVGVSVIAIIGQVVVVLMVGKEFSQHYLDISRTNASWVSSVAASRLDNSDASDEEEIAALSRLIAQVVDVEKVIVSRENQEGYTVRNQSVTMKNEWNTSFGYKITHWLTGYEDPDQYEFQRPLKSSSSAPASLLVKINPNLVNERRQGALFNALMSIIIGLLIFVELIILLIKYMDRLIRVYRSQDTQPTNKAANFHYSLMRPSMFLFLFGIDISISFLPLHMERLYEPIFGLSKAIVMGLPISVEFFCVGVAILFSGYWLDRSGWHKPYLWGLAIASVGSLWSWLATDAIQFILSRGLVGIGYGFALMSAQGFVIRYSDEKNKAQGLAQVYAGLYAGSICGGAAGGMLAERFGFSTIFLLGAGVLAFAILYTVIFLRDAFSGPPERRTRPREMQGEDTVRVADFLRDRSVIALILFCSIPASVVIVGFLNYFSPIYMSRIGLSQSTIGQVLIIYGVCLIFLGPWAGKLIDAMDDKKPFIVLSGVLGAACLLVFSQIDGLPAMVIAVVLLGLSSAFIFAAQAACLLQLRVSKELGDGKAMGIFSSSGRIGQTLGPIIFATVLAVSTIENAATWIGLAYVVVTLLFILTIKRERRGPLVTRTAS